MGAAASNEQAKIWRHDALPGATLMHVRYRSHRFRPHGHDAFTICAVQEGVAGLAFARRTTSVAAGGFSFIPPGEIHAGGCLSRELEYRTVYLRPDVANEILGTGAEGDGVWTIREARPREPVLLREFAAAHRRLERDREADVDELLAILGEVLRRYGEVAPRPAACRRRAVEKALTYLHRFPDRPVALAELAEHVRMSRFHLLRVFRDAVGLPPHAYHIQYRIRRSRELLLAARPLAEVALSAGFSDQSHFGAHFKSVLGISPGRYARSLRRVAC